MSLITCSECGHEVSTTAKACPNCGHPLAPPPVIHRNVVVANTLSKNRALPNWAFVLFGLAGVILLFFVVILISRNNEDETADRNINVNLATKRTMPASSDTVRTSTTPVDVQPVTGSQTVTVPSTSTNPSSTTTVAPSTSQDVKTIPPPTSDKGMVLIAAKIATSKGTIQAVRAEKFYLLDESLDSILSKAKLEPIEGQDLVNSFGLSVLYPSRYGEFNSKALNAIKNHIKYNVMTDSNGKARIKDVNPDSYYLFGVTKSGNAYAVWDSPITVQTGENILNLSPERMVEVKNDTGDED